MYGAAQEEKKDSFLCELAFFCSRNKDPVIIGGDFNIIRFPSEKKNKPMTVGRHSNNFNAIISAYELIDIRLTNGKFTWSNNQSNPILEKLDRILVSKDWEDLFPRVTTYRLPREVSDHNPIILCTDLATPLKHLSFKFELSWLSHPDFKHKVEEIWQAPCHAESAFDRIQLKIKKFK